MVTAPESKRVRSRSREKGTATRRSELLQKERIMPNTDVPSKLKAMLQESKQQSAAAGAVENRRKKVPGRWDDIMSRIAEGQRQEIRIRKENRAAGADGGADHGRVRRTVSR